MRILFTALIVFAALSYAVDENGNNSPGISINPEYSPGTDGFIVDVIETWHPSAPQILGLDWLNSTPDRYVLFACATQDKVYAWDTQSETTTDLSLSASNLNCFGVAAGPAGSILSTNDWGNSSLFVWNGSAWSTQSNPAGSNGRGMEFDEDTGDYWEASSSGSTYTLYRFIPGVGQSSYVITQPTNQLSGIALFPYNGNLGVVVTNYNAPHNFYFYEFNGSTLTYIGTTPCPAMGQTSSFGLCYAESRNTFFWSWTSGTPSLTELEITYVGLTRSTWGSIKTML